MNRWIRGFLICLIFGSVLAGLFVLVEGEEIFTKDNYVTLGIVLAVVVVLYAFDLFLAAHFFTTFRKKTGFINFIGVCVVLVAILMLFIHRCTP